VSAIRLENIGLARAALQDLRLTRVMSSVWLAVRAAPMPAPPTTAQANACHGRSTNAKPA